MLILQCSPRPNGSCANLARAFASGLAEILPPDKAREVQIIRLADLVIRPCMACDACAGFPHRCHLDPDGGKSQNGQPSLSYPLPEDRHSAKPMPGQKADQTGWLLDQIAARQALLIVSPIYFYALPAPLKALIDRAQRFYHARPQANPAPSLVALLAGRSRGKQLFSGSLLTINYFLAALGRKIDDKRLLPGQDLVQYGDGHGKMDGQGENQAASQQMAAIRNWGRQTGSRLAKHPDRLQLSEIPA